MKDKGFTLIELLAVIVILAIIALIAVPIILGIINSTKKESIERSEELYLSAVKNAIARKNLNEPNKEFNPTICKVNKDGNLSCTLGEEVVALNIEVEGNRPCSGTIIINNGKIENEAISFGNCYYADNSGASIPELMDILTPVVYDEENDEWIIADPTSEWYNYDKQEWANAVILSETGKNKKIGEEINIPNSEDEIASSDVQAMFVWIPRYSYTIKKEYGRKLNEDDNEPTKELPGAIDIKFVGTNVKDNGSASYTDEIGASWYTHPAFTFGSDELKGIWVGKFETSHIDKGKTNNDLNCIDENCESADGIRILPNVISLRNNNISNMFYATRSMSRNENSFGIDSSKTDTHMMKNNEWGTVAYLSQSKYGKYGNKDYTNVNKEVYKNDSSKYYTGRSSGKPANGDSSEEGTCKYDDNGASREEGTGLCGPGASTTGNITGIYDMSGGTYEYVMGNYNGITGPSGFSSLPNLKYYDKYTSSGCINDECKGHAMNETQRWYGDDAIFLSGSKPWFDRGGGWKSGNVAGMFPFGPVSNGSSSSEVSFRVVFTPIL